MFYSPQTDRHTIQTGILIHIHSDKQPYILIQTDKLIYIHRHTDRQTDILIQTGILIYIHRHTDTDRHIERQRY